MNETAPVAAMIKSIPVAQLRIGMYVHDLNCDWLDHNFVRNRFEIDSPELLDKVRALGQAEIIIDTELGLDVAPQLDDEDAAAPDPALSADPAPPLRSAPKPAPRLAPYTRAHAERLHGEANLIVRDLMGDVRLGKQIEIEKIEPMVESIVDSIFRRQDALLPLARLKQHDEYTFQHSVSVCALMVSFARALEQPREIIREIAIGALLHDVGKAKVPDTILNKPAKLTDAEFTRMKNHVVQSKLILQATPGVSEIALGVAAEHHERFDGSGYPNKLKGEAISLYGQMAAIVNVYDAITSQRVYHKGMPPTEALRKLLEWSDSHFQPKLVHAFIRAVGIYPTGSLVRLESNRLAVVQAQHADSLISPLVKVMFHTKGYYLPPELVNLRQSQDRITSHENFETWQIDPTHWLPE